VPTRVHASLTPDDWQPNTCTGTLYGIVAIAVGVLVGCRFVERVRGASSRPSNV
jgi:hypothetical protein